MVILSQGYVALVFGDCSHSGQLFGKGFANSVLMLALQRLDFSFHRPSLRNIRRAYRVSTNGPKSPVPNDDCRCMVPAEKQAAVTRMCAFGEFLRGHLTALWALLRRAARIDQLASLTSIFSFVSDEEDE